MGKLAQLWISLAFSLAMATVQFCLFLYMVKNSHPQLQFFVLGWLSCHMTRATLGSVM